MKSRAGRPGKAPFQAMNPSPRRCRSTTARTPHSSLPPEQGRRGHAQRPGEPAQDGEGRFHTGARLQHGDIGPRDPGPSSQSSLRPTPGHPKFFQHDPRQ